MFERESGGCGVFAGSRKAPPRPTPSETGYRRYAFTVAGAVSLNTIGAPESMQP